MTTFLSLFSEHSNRQICRQDIALVPILVGAIKKTDEAFYGSLLAPYLAADDTFFVISSDFCHWFVEKMPFFQKNKNN
jgi:predicted class III extradiol MEMO1 family dioxygenase